MKYNVKENETRKQVSSFIREEYNRLKDCSDNVRIREAKRQAKERFGSSKIVRRAIDCVVERILCKENVPLKKQIDSQIENKMSQSGIAAALPSSGYSMGEKKCIRTSIFKIESDNTKEYSRSCKYRAKHGYVEVCMPLRDCYGCIFIGGLMTKVLGQVNPRIYKSYWFTFQNNARYGSDVTYEKVSGYVVSYGDGRMYHAKTLLLAKEELRRIKAGEKREKDLKKECKKEEAKRRKELAKEEKNANCAFKKFLKESFCAKYSVASGNCIPGTMNFIRQNNLKDDVVMTGKEFLSYYKDSSLKYYMRKLVCNFCKCSDSVSEKMINNLLKN